MCQKCRFFAFGFSVASWCVGKACSTSAPYHGITGALHTMTRQWNPKKKRCTCSVTVCIIVSCFCLLVCLLLLGEEDRDGVYGSVCRAVRHSYYIHWHWLLKTPWRQIPPPEKKRFLVLTLTPIKPSACCEIWLKPVSIQQAAYQIWPLTKHSPADVTPPRCHLSGGACRWICCKWSTLIR